MKSLYIIAFLALSIGISAQESKKAQEAEDQSQVVKQLREREAQMAKASQETTPQQPSTTLASDLGLEVKKKDTKAQALNSAGDSGKKLPNTATLAEIKASIPNRQASHSTAGSKNTNKNVAGLLSTPDLTLEQIKKTIPKN
ncbi:hypothetical protein ACKW6Q_14350 [Chryseobacterium kwangjuense]|uniref:Uncharacterized protein n=1 Tax=Chryseobacterium kwangjuense TaxID=267125 RepID=A0ABW9K495_9FLAO